MWVHVLFRACSAEGYPVRAADLEVLSLIVYLGDQPP
jgi:hypothetical protein